MPRPPLVALLLAFASVPAVGQELPPPARLPSFIPTVRAYGGGGFHDFQRASMKDLGLGYVQWEVGFTWDFIERGDDHWKWGPLDAEMDRFADAGLAVIPFLMCPKSPGLPWDPSVTRTDPEFRAQYGEFARAVVARYRAHPAWSGLIAVWGGSADVWDHDYPLTDPEVVVPILNAAYDGIKAADPNTVVIGFNFATTTHSVADWEEYHVRAFALAPRFDWYGAQSHGVPATWLQSPDAYTGVAGLVNVRKFLDTHGYADKPLWMNEAGYACGEDLGGLPEPVHAQQVAQCYIVGRALEVNLRGWVYFQYFHKTHGFEDGADYGMMTPLDQGKPPRPRLTWTALRTLIRTVAFFDYAFETRLAGEFNGTDPFVLRFARAQKPGSKLWVVFSPQGSTKEEPVSRETTIRLAPAAKARLVSMLGEEKTVSADAEGRLTVMSTAAPVYVLADVE